MKIYGLFIMLLLSVMLGCSNNIPRKGKEIPVRLSVSFPEGDQNSNTSRNEKSNDVFSLDTQINKKIELGESVSTFEPIYSPEKLLDAAEKRFTVKRSFRWFNYRITSAGGVLAQGTQEITDRDRFEILDIDLEAKSGEEMKIEMSFFQSDLLIEGESLLCQTGLPGFIRTWTALQVVTPKESEDIAIEFKESGRSTLHMAAVSVPRSLLQRTDPKNLKFVLRDNMSGNLLKKEWCQTDILPQLSTKKDANLILRIPSFSMPLSSHQFVINSQELKKTLEVEKPVHENFFKGVPETLLEDAQRIAAQMRVTTAMQVTPTGEESWGLSRTSLAAIQPNVSAPKNSAPSFKTKSFLKIPNLKNPFPIDYNTLSTHFKGTDDSTLNLGYQISTSSGFVGQLKIKTEKGLEEFVAPMTLKENDVVYWIPPQENLKTEPVPIFKLKLVDNLAAVSEEINVLAFLPKSNSAPKIKASISEITIEEDEIVTFGKGLTNEISLSDDESKELSLIFSIKNGMIKTNPIDELKTEITSTAEGNTFAYKGNIENLNKILEEFAYRPKENSFEPDAMKITVSDLDPVDPLEATTSIEFNITPVKDPPSKINLSQDNLDENSPAGTLVGYLSALDVDSPSTFTYSLSGSDASFFTITENRLYTASVFNFEFKNNLLIAVQATDTDGLGVTENFVIKVNNKPESPLNILLSNSVIPENMSLNSFIGMLSTIDPDNETRFLYALSGAHANKFKISNGKIFTDFMFNFEIESHYPITITATDPTGLAISKTFVINITDINENPSHLILSTNVISENQPYGTLIGDLSVTDPDAGDTITYSLPPSFSSLFRITGYQLKSVVAFNYEQTTSYNIPITATDRSGASTSATFTVNIQDQNESPLDITLSSNSVDEEQPLGTAIGTLNTQDPDTGDSFTYSLTGTHASHFSITGNQLKTALIFNYEFSNSYSINITTTDSAGLTYTKSFTINILDITETTHSITLSNQLISENQTTNSVIGSLSVSSLSGSITYSISSYPNGLVQLSGSQISTAVIYNFENLSNFDLIVTASDASGSSVTRTIPIYVLNVNEAPTDIAISSTTISEGLPEKSLVGHINTSDPDTGDSFTYSLSGTDANKFFIDNDKLYTAEKLSYSDAHSYSIIISSTDASSLTFDKAFSIIINDQPASISEIGNQFIREDSEQFFVKFLMENTDSPPPCEQFTATSNNSTLFAAADLLISTLSSPVCKLDLRPLPNAWGSARITLSWTDGTESIQREFEVTVTPTPDAPFLGLINAVSIYSGTSEIDFLIKDDDGLSEIGCSSEFLSYHSTLSLNIVWQALGTSSGSFQQCRAVMTVTGSSTGAHPIYFKLRDHTDLTNKRLFTVYLNQPVPSQTSNLLPTKVSGLRAQIQGSCSPGFAGQYILSSSHGLAQSVMCKADGVFEGMIHLPAGEEPFFVELRQMQSGMLVHATGVTYQRHPLHCPPGYIGVPASTTAGLGNSAASLGDPDWWLDTGRDFCVMKYPAKEIVVGSVSIATSKPGGVPWTNIPRGIETDYTTPSAFQACYNSESHSRLISNTQWQTVARNIERTPANWSGGVLGSGMLARGHSDNVPSQLLENSTDDNPYFGTGNSLSDGWGQRRIHFLSNGEVTWDFAGNVAHFVSDNAMSLGTYPILSSASASTEQYSNTSLFPVSTGSPGLNKSIFAPFSATLAGALLRGNSDIVVRGGSYLAQPWHGLFGASLNQMAADSSTGFRCAAQPTSHPWVSVAPLPMP